MITFFEFPITHPDPICTCDPDPTGGKRRSVGGFEGRDACFLSITTSNGSVITGWDSCARMIFTSFFSEDHASHETDPAEDSDIKAEASTINAMVRIV